MEFRCTRVAPPHAVLSNPLTIGSPPCCSRYGGSDDDPSDGGASGSGWAFTTSTTTNNLAATYDSQPTYVSPPGVSYRNCLAQDTTMDAYGEDAGGLWKRVVYTCNYGGAVTVYAMH